MREQTNPTPIPPEPDILIQDLEDIPENPQQGDAPQQDDAPQGDVCVRCSSPVQTGEAYCEECTATMGAYPIRPLAWILGTFGVLVSLIALFLLATNILIARPILRGDKALRQDDLRACYAGYAESYDIAARLNDLLFPEASLTFFTNGTRTLEKQIRAAYVLNGPYHAGQLIRTYYSQEPPQSLQKIYAEYLTIAAFVEDMQQSFSDYRGSLAAGDTGKYDDMVSLVDAAAKRNPETPEYMVQYYRFSVSYSLNDDPARTCALLDTLFETAPDALWLYASEGIHAYDLGEQYAKALQLCNRLMQRDASNPATVAYTVEQLRLLRRYDDALKIYDSALAITEPSSEMERQRAIVLMLQGETEQAKDILIGSYSPETATLEHVATLCVCAYACDDEETYAEYKTLLDSYMPYAQVDAFANGELTLEDIFLTGGGEIR